MSTPVGSTRALRARERELLAALLGLALAAVAFTAWPDIDLQLSAWCRDGEHGFVGDRWWAVRALYEAVPWLGRAAGVIGLGIALRHWRHPGPMGVRWWRRWLMLGVVLLLGLGVLVNGLFKEHWGRARPHAVAVFGGDSAFTPALRPAAQCAHNCSFVSGHAATGFALIAFGSLGPARTRRRWLLVGAAAGGVIGAVRIAQGGHFVSDVAFAGLAIWLLSVLVREAWLRIVARRRARLGPACAMRTSLKGQAKI
ncbi:MAG TPA: phosphatase PAP2 family protein [Burkholderiaceae bacterium]|jgi:lipid A 4'-phosphatase|nr:phosphatase PAP2 family protein [Burkholderiaceae bacterium]